MANKTILIAVDNSKECLKAVDFVLEHFPQGYSYHLLHVQVSCVASELVADPEAAGLAHEHQYKLDQEMQAASMEALKNFFVPKAKVGGAEVKATILHSYPDGSKAIGAAICEYAEKHKPVALVLMKEEKSTVECLKALDFAISHFPIGYTYHLVHVHSRPLGSSVVETFEKLSVLEQEMVDASQKFMEDVFAERAKSAGAEAYAVVVETDSDSTISVGPALCKYAWEVKADALILMRQNKSAVSRFFMGSVTRYCAVHSPVPVLIVPNAP
ncbi:hypothetical protein COCOBI_05-0930 [Coccomyxa sp. Obi]|nr:hypothetical protein COCOBI_05-0930 [Coccomyxa sp. Obi]